MYFKKRVKENKGQSMIETAFMIPIILLVVLVAVELGLFLNSALIASNAAREAARLAAIESDGSSIRNAIMAKYSTVTDVIISYPESGTRVVGEDVEAEVTNEHGVITSMGGMILEAAVGDGNLNTPMQIKRSVTMAVENED